MKKYEMGQQYLKATFEVDRALFLIFYYDLCKKIKTKGFNFGHAITLKCYDPKLDLIIQELTNDAYNYALLEAAITFYY